MADDQSWTRWKATTAREGRDEARPGRRGGLAAVWPADRSILRLNGPTTTMTAGPGIPPVNGS